MLRVVFINSIKYLQAQLFQVHFYSALNDTVQRVILHIFKKIHTIFACRNQDTYKSELIFQE